ncbi:MAG: L-serine ammonia-lyase, iron-sulfur-dependent, subunit alpha, partial [Blautia glucerasea]|nr:L-serine ammonia-lyase, iron-sulfur-dependent, subunit alpha [Blautia glucerasea]
MELNYSSVSQLIQEATKKKVTISSLVLNQQAQQMELSQQELYKKMLNNYQVMKSCITPGCAKDLKSTSGLTGGDAWKMKRSVEKKENLTGSLIGGALYRALAVSELNASMGRIVAAPTAGSCGILPAAVLTMEEEKHLSEKQCVMSLFTASAIGMVIANNASLAGARGGCQAECGSASAMAAAAIVELAGGTPEMVGSAVAIALKNILGLVCDPVAGLVEIPCIKRNASGVTGAFTAAELALAGIKSAIPADEV